MSQSLQGSYSMMNVPRAHSFQEVVAESGVSLSIPMFLEEFHVHNGYAMRSRDQIELRNKIKENELVM